MRSCLNHVRKFFAKKSPEPQLEAANLNIDRIIEQEQQTDNEPIAQFYNNQSQPYDNTPLRYHEAYESQDKAKQAITPAGLSNMQDTMKISRSQELFYKDEIEPTRIYEPANKENINIYIEEYKTLVEEKQKLLSASTPYTTADSFDFEQLFDQNSRRYSEAQTLRLFRQTQLDESEYLAGIAESCDIVTPLPSEQARPLRPVTLPRCAVPLELTAALRKLSDSAETESVIERALSQRLNRYRSSHKLVNQSMDKHLVLNTTESHYDNKQADENEVILRRHVQRNGNKVCSLFERRQPDCPKLKLCLKSTISSGIKPNRRLSFDAEVFSI